MNLCKFCSNRLEDIILDLGTAPPSNALLTEEDMDRPERYSPLVLYRCGHCGLVQVPVFVEPRLMFNADYPYYSTQSPSNVKHAKDFVQDMMDRFDLKAGDKVIELGSNDGYLLSQFPSHIRAAGVEPSRGPAELAIKNGICTKLEFFNGHTVDADNLFFRQTKLMCGINVFAHMPEINSTLQGIKKSLDFDGSVVFEFPHALNLAKKCQFDTVYHEHYFYFALRPLVGIFKAHGMVIYDVEEIPQHGGSLRIFAGHVGAFNHTPCSMVDKVLQDEDGIYNLYDTLQDRANNVKYDLLTLLIQLRRAGIRVAAYGAAAKGNTLLNFCGIRPDLISYVVDRSEFKLGKYLPGSRIPIVNQEYLYKDKPGYVLILPWNIKNEIMEQLSFIKNWGGKFAIASGEGVQVYDS